MRSPSRNRHARVVASSLLAIAASIACEQRAEAAPPELDAAGIEGCPSAADLRRAIATQLGRDDFDASTASRVSVRIRRTDASLAADIVVAPPDGVPTARTLEDASCSALVRAAALSIALAMEADAPAPAPAPVPAPPAPAPAPAPASTEPDALPARDVRTSRVVLLASGLTSLGLLPVAAAGGAASARVRITDVVWLSARGFFLPEARMPNDAFGMTLAAGGAGACVEPFGSHSIAAVGCAHVLAGSLSTTNANVPLHNGGAKAFGAASLSAGARVRVAGPLTLEGAIEATVPFAHPTIETAICPVAGFQQPFAAVALVLGAGVSIP